MKKKADLSINIIIVAAIALIVLVVLIAIFTGRMGNWGKDITDATKPSKKCTDVSGTWKVQCDSTIKEKAIYGLFSDAQDNPGKTCCVRE